MLTIFHKLFVTRLDDENRKLLACLDSQLFCSDKSVSLLIEGSSLGDEVKAYINEPEVEKDSRINT